MNQRSVLTRTLALIGTILVLLPIAFMLLLSVRGTIGSGSFMMDYLIPGELFPLVVLGGGLLVIAARLAHARRRRLIEWSLGVAVASLILAQGLAIVTGVASGETAAEGLPLIVVLALLAIYDLTVLVLGVAGALLVRDLFAGAKGSVPPAAPAQR